ncbi:PAP2 superfamily C-terminal-domain-containing protein [Paraphysoderma sedebokerense]|nr:PAP2 superfamily C-terminal-domain-containing protein [Paraphysoderma sedebokerense]
MSSFSISPSQSRSQSPSPTRSPKLTITKPPSRRSSVQSSSSFNHKQTDSNSPLPSAIEPPSNYLFPSLRNFPHNELSASGNGKRSIWKRIILWLGDVKVEQHGKRRLVLSMVFYLICGYINVIFCNLAELRRAELYKRGFSRTLILPDLGHDYVPHLDIPFLPDYFIISLGVATVILISKHQHRLGILRRFFYVHGTLLLFRSLTIISTTLPDPQKKCSLPRIERGLFDSFNPFFSDTCGDLVFSGHTVVLTLLTMIWEDYGPKKWYIQRIVQLDACLGILSLLSTRYHYTIDVIIAFYLARRGWKWYVLIFSMFIHFIAHLIV